MPRPSGQLTMRDLAEAVQLNQPRFLEFGGGVAAGAGNCLLDARRDVEADAHRTVSPALTLSQAAAGTKGRACLIPVVDVSQARWHHRSIIR